MKGANGKGRFDGSTMPLETCYIFGCSLARIRFSIFAIFVIAVKKGSAEQFEDATRPTRRAFNLGRNADHTDEQRDRWADWELERFGWMAFFDPQSLSRRNKERRRACETNSRQQWCLVGNTLESRVLVSFHLRTVEPTMKHTIG